MKRSTLSLVFRIVLVLAAAVAVVGFRSYNPAQAASPFITITAVKVDESATVHATGLPAGMSFTVRMGPSSGHAENGTVVGQAKSGSDGIFDATFAIPAALKGNATIAIRIDSATGGWYAYNWFTNKTQGTSGTVSPTTVPTTASTTTPSTSTKSLYINVIAVEKNKRITVAAYGFPANTDFNVRVGPLDTFFTKYVSLGKVNTGAGGNFSFNLTLPDDLKDVEKITVRLDSAAKQYAYNYFVNVNAGTVDANPSKSVPGSSTPSTTPTATATPTTSTNLPITQTSCQITQIDYPKTMPTYWDFDVVWTVKNTGTRDWNNHEIDYRYQSGEKMHKFSEPYDLPSYTKVGESVKLLVDLKAPGTTGTYTTQFVLAGDTGALCSLPVTVTVK